MSYEEEWAKHGFTYRDWLEQNGVCPECESPETKTEYESGENGKVLKCAQCGFWLCPDESN